MQGVALFFCFAKLVSERWGYYDNTSYFRDSIILLWNIQPILLLSDAADGPFRQIFMEATLLQGGGEKRFSQSWQAEDIQDIMTSSCKEGTDE